jgi:hypothetical protein
MDHTSACLHLCIVKGQNSSGTAHSTIEEAVIIVQASCVQISIGADELGGNVAGEAVVGEVNGKDGAELRRNWAQEVVGRQVEVSDLELTKRGDEAQELIVRESENDKVREIAELRRNGPGEIVGREVKIGKLRKIAELRRDGPQEIVGREVKKLKAGEIAELRGNGPREIVGF